MSRNNKFKEIRVSGGNRQCLRAYDGASKYLSQDFLFSVLLFKV